MLLHLVRLGLGPVNKHVNMHKHMHMTCDMWQDRSPPACNYAYRFRPDRGRSLAWSARTAPRAMMRYVNGFSSVFKEPLLP